MPPLQSVGWLLPFCAGTSPPLEPMAGRTVIFDDLVQNPHWGGNGSTLAPWKVALATLLPTLAVLLVAWQVGVAGLVELNSRLPASWQLHPICKAVDVPQQPA